MCARASGHGGGVRLGGGGARWTSTHSGDVRRVGASGSVATMHVGRVATADVVCLALSIMVGNVFLISSHSKFLKMSFSMKHVITLYFTDQS